jgi:hypothetical protein
VRVVVTGRAREEGFCFVLYQFGFWQAEGKKKTGMNEILR